MWVSYEDTIPFMGKFPSDSCREDRQALQCRIWHLGLNPKNPYKDRQNPVLPGKIGTFKGPFLDLSGTFNGPTSLCRTNSCGLLFYVDGSRKQTGTWRTVDSHCTPYFFWELCGIVLWQLSLGKQAMMPASSIHTFSLFRNPESDFQRPYAFFIRNPASAFQLDLQRALLIHFGWQRCHPIFSRLWDVISTMWEVFGVARKY